MAQEYNLMKHASLQAGDASFLHVILHFRTGMHYLKLMLHIIETCLPLNGRLYFIRDALHLLEKKHYILQGIVEGFMKLFQGYYIRCTYVSAYS